MKKVLVLLLVLSMLLVPTATADTGIDYTSMTDAELVTVRDACIKELGKRGFASKDVTVPVGTYVVGEDIPAGSYTITFASSSGFARVSVYDEGKSYSSFSEQVAKDSPIGKVVLKNGQTIEINYDPVTFSPYKGLGF